MRISSEWNSGVSKTQRLVQIEIVLKTDYRPDHRMPDVEQLEYINCPYCGHDDSRPWGAENGYFAIRCRSCGLVYVNPRPDANSISEAARTGLHEGQTDNFNTVSPLGFRKAKKRMFERRLRKLFSRNQLIDRNLRWLDIGAGFGELLAAVSELAGSDSIVEGIEPCEPKVAVARRRQLHVTNRRLNEINGTYDFISLINVLSHLPDPSSFLRTLPHLLAPDGHLFLVTGNGADVSREQFPGPLFLPDHLVFAGEKHVRGFLKGAGFEIVELQRYQYFLPEATLLILLKNIARWVLGRHQMPLSNRGPYRSLFIVARLKSADNPVSPT